MTQVQKIKLRLENFWLTLPVFLATRHTPGQPTGGEPNAPGRRIIEIEDPLKGADFITILNNIVNFLLLAAAPIAVIMVLWAGFLFMTAGGSEKRVALGKKALTWTVIGIAVLLISKGVVSIIRGFLTP